MQLLDTKPGTYLTIANGNKACRISLGLCHSLCRDSPEACRSPSSLAVAARSASLPPDGVVHLVIHPSAKVGWRHQAGSKLELSISADATAQHVAEELDLPEGEHQLLYNGQVLGSTQSLASYGILSDTGTAITLLALDSMLFLLSPLMLQPTAAILIPSVSGDVEQYVCRDPSG